MNQDILIKEGINCSKAIARFMGDSDLFESILESFLEDKTFDSAQAAYNAKDYKQLFVCAHTYKGVAGNLEMTELYKISSELSEVLRSSSSNNANNNVPDKDVVDKLFAEFTRIYEKVRAAIAAAKG